MGRPRGEKQPVAVWNIKLVLYSPEDDDLIALRRRTPERKRAAMVKATMRSGQLPGFEPVDEDDAEMFEALGALVF